MKYIDEFRNPDTAAALVSEIQNISTRISDKKIRIMEVCGSHTMAIGRYGIRQLLPENIDLISGPGCPVCVTSPSYIDAAIKLAKAGHLICTFGDMLNVPGSEFSLAAVRSEGGHIELCYSPLNALEFAEKMPEKEVVFLGTGFETTIAPVISIVDIAIKKNIQNLSIFTAFKLIIPALYALASDPEIEIDAFLCPAHVSAIIGADAYITFVEKHRIPCVIAGFEPLDILFGIEGILRQVSEKKAFVENQYDRIVSAGGNLKAQMLMERFLEKTDAEWRGIGIISESGMTLKNEFENYDAQKKFDLKINPEKKSSACLCGEVLKGKIKPPDCPLFAKSCTPSNPVGPCMVSSEGTCSAWYKYSRP